MALPLAAQAQPVTGLYIGAGIGVNYLGQETIGTPANIAGGGQFKSGLGPAAELSLGWGFGNGLRAEIQGNWMDNKFNKVGGFSGLTSAGGWEQKFGGLVNVLYDFNGLAPWIVPYIGAGVGYEDANMGGVRAYGPAGQINMANSTQGAFAYQGILGAAFPVAPGLALTAEYRFLGLAGNRNYSAVAYPANTHLPSIGFTAQASADYNSAILIGLRYNFGVAAAPAPAPAPMAAPAPAPARSYLVFFDWDKATLTTRAQQIIKEAADNSTRVKYTRIEVNGYTDTSGTPQYNQGLSVRRAQAVAAELVKDGVPQGAIAIQGFGETHLLVPTGPGVREPQNRRVEIIIR
jgi:outer membrane protein OmpA-like peptidoglycan-associated protein